jgi:hypothetical protein
MKRASSTVTSRDSSVTSSTTVLSSTMRISPLSSSISIFGLDIGPVLLGQGGMNAVLQKLVQLLARDLLEIGQLTKCRENFR